MLNLNKEFIEKLMQDLSSSSPFTNQGTYATESTHGTPIKESAFYRHDFNCEPEGFERCPICNSLVQRESKFKLEDHECIIEAEFTDVSNESVNDKTVILYDEAANIPDENIRKGEVKGNWKYIGDDIKGRHYIRINNPSGTV